MSEIIRLRLWNDPGFTDGAVEVPSHANITNLPDADFDLDDDYLVPSKTRFFNELKVKLPFSDAQCISYLEMTVEYNNGETDPFIYYGWVDSVIIESDNAEFPLVTLNFHIDLWRSFLRQARFGSGLVTRRRRSGADPIQNLTSRYRTVSKQKAYQLIPESLVGAGAYWAIVNYTYEGHNSETAESRVLVVPVSKTPGTIQYMKLTADGTLYQVPRLEEWVTSKYDELFGIKPSSISSVFISPVPPLQINSGLGTFDDPFIVVGPAPSPTPTTTTYAGVDAPYPVRINGDGDVVLSNDNEIAVRDWENTRIRTVRGIGRDETGFAVHLSGAFMTPSDEYLDTTTGSNARPGKLLSALSVDEYIRSVLGDAVFDNLADGDTAVFNRIFGLYRTHDFEQTTHSIEIMGKAVYTLSWRVRVSNQISSDTTLTFNNGTFGDFWVLVDGAISTSTVTITTHTFAPSTAEYEFIESSLQVTPKYGALATKTDRFAQYSARLNQTIRTSDTETLVLTDMDGSIVATFPWGLWLSEYSFRCVVTATSAYVQFRFDGLDSSAEGLQISVPLPSLDITSNSWSEYNYSGQRDFDIAQRKIARDRALVDGLTGALSLGAQGAMLGGLKESQDWMPTTRSIGNASLFGALGASAGVAGSLVNYGTAGTFNDRLQNATDLLQARQTDAIITPGGGCDWIYHGRAYQISVIVPDDYSLKRFENDIALNGIIVSEPTPDCSSLVRGTGPLTIENLIVLGEIPVEAKQYIKQKLNNGVRLK